MIFILQRFKTNTKFKLNIFMIIYVLKELKILNCFDFKCIEIVLLGFWYCLFFSFVTDLSLKNVQ